jgi:hypothetical protein
VLASALALSAVGFTFVQWQQPPAKSAVVVSPNESDPFGIDTKSIARTGTDIVDPFLVVSGPAPKLPQDPNAITNVDLSVGAARR